MELANTLTCDTIVFTRQIQFKFAGFAGFGFSTSYFPQKFALSFPSSCLGMPPYKQQLEYYNMNRVLSLGRFQLGKY